MRLLNLTLIKLTVGLIIGILIGYYFHIPVVWSLGITLVSLVFLGYFLLKSKRQFIQKPWFGLIAMLSIVLTGILTTGSHDALQKNTHFTKHITHEDSLQTITLKIKEVLKPSRYYDKYIAEVVLIDSISVTGKTLINLQKDSIENQLDVDAIIVVRNSFQALKPPINPNQFDYKAYLEHHHIYRELVLRSTQFLVFEPNRRSILGLAYKFRTAVNSKLKKHPFSTSELAIINALLLGQRQDLSPEEYKNYADAGAIHILAVSGLHVGVILLIFSFLLKPLDPLRHGPAIKTVLLLFILWGFAFVAGLSPSVTRATTMFSVVSIAQNLKRPTNIYNTLVTSMFLILLFKPLYIFDVGFQLSYAAVFAIVSIDPYLFRLWKPKYKITKIYWRTLTVTIAAQLGILPLSLYYFHQFPGLFFISNLVIIPFLGLILGFGILVILLVVLNLLPQFMAKGYGYVIDYMNRFIAWIADQDIFLFKNIRFTEFHLIVLYGLIIFGSLFFLKKRYKYLVLVIICFIGFQVYEIYGRTIPFKNEFIIFHQTRSTLIGNRMKNTLSVASTDSIYSTENKIISDYTLAHTVDHVKKDSIRNFYNLKDKLLFVIDSLGVYNLRSVKPHYVLLRESPKLNLNRLIDSLKPKYVIADGSNYNSYKARWEAICDKRKIPFHRTDKKGAFIIKY
ncbi:ComEC/Rec2 family competence protein [Gaetbulibacter sp. M240]|uniref:ComEC/Rec2 family competence protein n=1 Tax=Gaetbulibacter sp. M240 TaxID=3126511 RepID=UPI00374E8C17